MPPRRCAVARHGWDSGSDIDYDYGVNKMRCLSCDEDYDPDDAGTCKECYEEANDTEEELKREIDDLKVKVAFLKLLSPFDLNNRSNGPSFTDVVLVAFDDCSAGLAVPVPAHKAVLIVFLDEPEITKSHNSVIPVGIALICVSLASTRAIWPLIHINGHLNHIVSGDSNPEPHDTDCYGLHLTNEVSRSPVFKAMLENDMEESRSGTIKISDVSYDVLRAFVNYLYTTEACLDDQMACDLLVLAEKYQVKQLKTYCEKFLMVRLNWDKAVANYAFAHQYNAQQLLDAALTLIIDNMDKLTKHTAYVELVESNPRLVVEIYEAYLSKQVNTAQKGSSLKK